MATLKMEASNGSYSPNVSNTIIVAAALSIASLLLYRAFFAPLHKVPGPLVCRITSLWTYYHSYIGDECTRITELHKKYGPVVRIAPNEVCISDGSALAPIYVDKGGFLKAPCYANFDIEGHETIFSTRDPEHRSVRSRAVVPIFSMSNIRSSNNIVEGCVNVMIARLKEEAADSKKSKERTGQPKPVNVHNIARGLAVDVVSSYLFGQSYGGVSEKSNMMTASPYVDSLVAVSRFFFLPNWLFLTLETARQQFWPDKKEEESAKKVGGFLQSLVHSASKDDGTYQGRLLKAGISTHESEVQCKDVVFAGTDSTATNLSTIMWNLAKHCDVYTKLREEIGKADAEDAEYSPQSLHYLDAVIREGLRISMANPARFPRQVPSSGWSFQVSDEKRFDFSAGTIVGMQPWTLHFNPAVFPDPFDFKPERWLDNPTPEMQRDAVPFGLGSRQCIARNLATVELFLAVRAIVRANVLEGAEPVGEKIELIEWFNSRVKGDKVELVWK